MPIEELLILFGHSGSLRLILTNLELLISRTIASDKNRVTTGVLNPAPISIITNFLLFCLTLFKKPIKRSCYSLWIE